MPAQSILKNHPDDLHDLNAGGTIDKVVSLLHQDQAIILILGSSRNSISTLLDNLGHTLEKSSFVLRIEQPSVEHSLYQQLAAQLDIKNAPSAFPQLSALIEQTLSAISDRRIILLCSDVDSFDASSLEQLRQLSNLTPAGNSAISLVLCGAQDLLKKLESHRLRALRQRITAQFELDSPSKRFVAFDKLRWGIPLLLLGTYLAITFIGQNNHQDKITPATPSQNTLTSTTNTDSRPVISPPSLTLPPQDADQPETLDHVFTTEQEALQAMEEKQP